MANENTIQLDAKMQEIVDLAQQAGLGRDAEAIVRLALDDWWSERLIESIGHDEVSRMLDEAAADTSPGLSPDVVFAELRAELEQGIGRADAA